MDLLEVVDRQKGIIQALASIVAEQAAVIEQARLTGPGVDVIQAKRRMVQADMDKVEKALAGYSAERPW